MLAMLLLLAALPANAGMRTERQRPKGPDRNDSMTSQTLPPRHHDGGTTQTLPPDKKTTTTQPIAFDVRWLKSNIDLHTRMIVLCQTESAQTTSTEIKTFADDLATTLTTEVSQMQAWLTSWYGITYTPQTGTEKPSPGASCRCSLDQKFLADVIAYEHATICAAGFPTSMATHSELKTFATGLISEGNGVIRLMLAWQTLLIKMDMESYFQKDGPQPPLAG